MPTPNGVPMPAVAIEAPILNESYPPSPPHTPQAIRTIDDYSRDGAEDNTAAGMAYAQEQSLFEDERGQKTECLYEYDPEKTSLQHCAPGAGPTPQPPALIKSPVTSEGDIMSQLILTSERASSPEDDSPRVEFKRYQASNSPTLQQTPLKRSAETLPQALSSPAPLPIPTVTIESESSGRSTSSTSAHELAFEFSKIRLSPSFTSSYFRAGSRFTGTQQSDRHIYNVDVEITDVSIPDSSVSGYLKICGLTEDHPTLTTYFEGEIIGTRHTFQTRHPSWGATDKTDMQHWARFPAWRPLAKEARRPGFAFGKGWWNRENVFMRWKEHFLVPDHRVRSIQGASFEGFYYICFNQVEGRISGIYFHAKSEK